MRFEKSADTRVLEHVLSQVEIGETVTYDTLSKAIGRDVREFGCGSLQSARRALLRDKGVVFGVETNVGLVRLSDAGIVDSTESDRQRIKRAATRTISKLAVVKFDELDKERQRQHVVASAQMGALAMFAGKNAAKRIAAKVDGTKQVIAIGETLSMFK